MINPTPLGSGPIHWFADWPISGVPTTGSAVYTIWNREGAFIYVGMSGRSATATGKGPWGRLSSHASGRRSGDQFCVYVSDRFVLPLLQHRIAEIAGGSLSLDAETKDFIFSNLVFRCLAVVSPTEAYALEMSIQRGEWKHGRPLLNPLGERRGPKPGGPPRPVIISVIFCIGFFNFSGMVSFVEGDGMSADQDRCMAMIEPILGVLHDCLFDGMAFRQNPENYSAEAIAQQRGRTASNCVNDHAFHRLRERLEGRAGCHFINLRQMEVLNYFDQALIRLKRVNGAGRASNYPTGQQQDYDDQKILPGLPEGAVRLVAGYQADAMFMAIDRVIISRPIGREIEWAAQVTKFDEATAWEDITPARLEGFDRQDFNPARRRRRG